jgi:phosphoglycolate phosphatase-like HAD superfamily hydrolase/8-oxo-dGTP pyrophosphatase MutT (NUDIX family)
MQAQYEGALLWDLDGTLLFTAKGGRIALTASILEHTGHHVDLEDLATAGLTDFESVTAAVAATGVQPEIDLLHRVRRGYEQRLPDALLQREGLVLPGIADTLAGLAQSGRVANLLLTGNTRAGAEAKLARYGLSEWFAHGGGFSDGPGGRVPIARRALQVATELVRDLDRSRVLVVGDTPRDVECADAIGVRTLGVATGAHSVDVLLAAGAFMAVEQIPDATTLEALVLGEGGRVAAPRIAGVLLLDDDGAALFQHRDDKPGLNHAGRWVPPGGHADPGEEIAACARREFLEETEYVCDELHFLTRFDDHVGGNVIDLTMFWARYDGRQPLVCREGQALEFVSRADFAGRDIPPYLVDAWDAAIAAAQASARESG